MYRQLAISCIKGFGIAVTPFVGTLSLLGPLILYVSVGYHQSTGRSVPCSAEKQSTSLQGSAVLTQPRCSIGRILDSTQLNGYQVSMLSCAEHYHHLE